MPSSALRGRALARRLRELAERWLDEMEREPAREPHDLAWVLEMLKQAKLEERRRRPRRPLAARARAAAERLLDVMESDPDSDPYDLAWVLEMLRAARAEDATARADPPGRRFVVPSVPPDVLAREAAVAAEQRRQKRLRMAQSGPRRPPQARVASALNAGERLMGEHANAPLEIR